MASQSNSDNMWMGAATPDISMLSNLEEGSSWKTPASSQNTTTNMDVKDNAAPASFSKGLLEDVEWYTPEASLMELSSYSSPYNCNNMATVVDTRSSFGLLESSLNFDSCNNSSSNNNNLLTAGFRSAQASAMCSDDLGQGSSSGGLFSGISQGGQLSRSVPMDSFSSDLPPPTFNCDNQQGIINSSLSNMIGNNSNTHPNFPQYSPFPASTSFPQDNNNNNNKKLTNESDHPLSNGVVVSYQTTKSYQQQQQQQLSLFQKASTASGSQLQALSPASNDSMECTPGKGLSQQEDPNNDIISLDADDYDVKDDDDLDESGDGGDGDGDGDDGGPEEGAGHHGSIESDPQGKGSNNKGGKQRGLPAKNLMAERRRRKKLNDRLYMLRSVVPKITKMDRASILGDAIEYLKELQQRISDVHAELEATKQQQSRSMPSSPTSGGRAILNGLSPPVKEECPVLPNPENQPPRVEVRQRDRALNVHMFCARRPGLLLNTVRALDALGLDVQQAVISCFNGFALDLFRAEVKDAAIGPEEIKAVLLLTAGYGVQ